MLIKEDCRGHSITEKASTEPKIVVTQETVSLHNHCDVGHVSLITELYIISPVYILYRLSCFVANIAFVCLCLILQCHETSVLQLES